MLEELQAAGNDISAYLNRFEQDKETCEMLTSLFLEDTQYSEYIESYKNKNYEQCREHIHTIKGMTANIALTLLSQKASEIMKSLDNGEFDKMEVLTDELSGLYDSTVKIIKG